MKVTLQQRDMSLKQGFHSGYIDSQNFKENNNASVYNSNRGYSANKRGSFTGGKSEAAATVLNKAGEALVAPAKDKLLDKMLGSNWFGKFSEYSNEHNISTSALVALVLAGIMRPATIMALSGKEDREDNIYASGHAMASGIMGFIISTILTSPFDESIKKFFGNPDKYIKKSAKQTGKKPPLTLERMKATIKCLDGRIEKTAKFYEPMRKKLLSQAGAMETLAKNIPDWIIGVPRAMLTIALIPPILKYVFGVEKKKKPQNVVENKQIDTPKMDFIQKPVFQSVKGGVQ